MPGPLSHLHKAPPKIAAHLVAPAQLLDPADIIDLRFVTRRTSKQHYALRFTDNLERELRDVLRMKVSVGAASGHSRLTLLCVRVAVCTLSCARVNADFETGAFPGARMPVFSVQMIRFRAAEASPLPFVVYEIKYETASDNDSDSAAR